MLGSFDELFQETYKDFAPLYAKLKTGPTYEPGQIVAGERVHHRGTRTYKAGSHATA